MCNFCSKNYEECTSIANQKVGWLSEVSWSLPSRVVFSELLSRRMSAMSCRLSCRLSSILASSSLLKSSNKALSLPVSCARRSQSLPNFRTPLINFYWSSSVMIRTWVSSPYGLNVCFMNSWCGIEPSGRDTALWYKSFANLATYPRFFVPIS